MMASTLLLAGALLAQASPTLTVTGPAAELRGQSDWIDVGYHELALGQPHVAIARIEANREIEVGDPAALINLGTAHARLGETRRAQGYYTAAIASRTRYDLQLADGSWMDSRRAARLAISALVEGKLLALR